MPEEFEASGWDAITTVLERQYPGVEPRHLAPMISSRLGGPDPLDGLSIYANADHWHFVTYGMSDLYDNSDVNDPDSGYGFEFTFRVARTGAETDPPKWTVNFLSNLARYVTSTGNTFRAGHHMDLNGPIALSEADTAIRAITFAIDPELGQIGTPNGLVRFLQVVGITLDEYAVIEQWNADRLVTAMAPHLPLLVTDLRRRSLLDDPDVAAAVAEGIHRDGSSTGSLYVAESRVVRDRTGITLTFGASAAPRIGRILAARLPFGNGLLVEGPEGGVGLRAGDAFAIADLGDGLAELVLPPAVHGELSAVLQPVAGRFRLTTAPVTVEIVKSSIRDQNGQVVAEIG